MPSYKLPDGTTVSDTMPFSYEGINYPENWIRLSTAEDRETLGLELLPDPKPYDQVFYWGWDENDELIPKDHAALVEEYIGHVKRNAGSLLSDTDWMVIRKADTGVPIDASIAAWRQSIRDAAAAKIAAVEATSTTQELAEYITGAEYPVWPTLEAGEPEQLGNWSAFFDALLVSDVFAVARQAAAESLPANAAYTDLAAGLGLAKQGYPNIPAIQAGFKAILALLELTEEQEVELTGLIVSHNIPISLD